MINVERPLEGTIRAFYPQGDRSILIQINSTTRCQQLTSRYRVDTLYLQIGNLHIKPLSADSRPLILQCELLTALGYDPIDGSQLASHANFRHIFAFFLGRPDLQNHKRFNEILVAHCLIRKGRIFGKWTPKKCILYNGTLRIERYMEEDEVLLVANYRTEVVETRRGKALHLSNQTSTMIFLFDNTETLHLWASRCLQHEVSSSCDLSDQRLVLLPDSIFSAPNLTNITYLNLRRNSLQFKTCHQDELGTERGWSGPQLGWVEDLYRFSALTHLDLSSNRLSMFPLAVLQLRSLERLFLSDNQIDRIPAEIALLSLLSELDLSNNWLTELPSQLTNCNQLSVLNLTLNRFKKTLHCERNYLKVLDVNGQNLSYLNASFNALSTLVVMPMPVNLSFFSVASNQFSNLPNWITDLSKINHIDAHKNQLLALPERIFRVPSLSTLIVHSNRLTVLPDQIENCQIEFLDLHHNALESLPRLLFRSSHRLREVNVSANVLTELPSPNPVPDLNRVQILHAALNELDDRVVNTIIAMRRLRILNLSSNKLKFFDENDLCCLISLEELNLSTNELSSISPLILALPSLQILRLHSNQLTTLPDLSHSKALKIFDVCSNRLSQLHSTNYMAENLRQIDLSCNPELPAHIHSSRAREIREVKDLSSRSLVHRHSFVDIANVGGHSVSVGFSETTGQRNRLSVRQILPDSRHISPVLALVDASGNASLAAELTERLFRMAETQEVVDENTLRNWILSAHEWIGEAGERVGASILLISIQGNQIFSANVGGSRAWIVVDGKIHPLVTPLLIDGKTYEHLRVANAIIDEENFIFGVCPYVRQIGFTAFFPAILPKATVRTANLKSQKDFLILGSKAVGECLSEPLIKHIVATTSNPQVAAKKIQDAVQSFNWTDNVSVIVARTGNVSHTKARENVEREEISELTLQKIEERIEQISRVIARIEEDNDGPMARIRKDHFSRKKESEAETLSVPSTAPPPDPSTSYKPRRELNDEIRDRWLQMSTISSKSYLVEKIEPRTIDF